jgi:hypothetical protein
MKNKIIIFSFFWFSVHSHFSLLVMSIQLFHRGQYLNQNPKPLIYIILYYIYRHIRKHGFMTTQTVII